MTQYLRGMNSPKETVAKVLLTATLRTTLDEEVERIHQHVLTEFKKPLAEILAMSTAETDEIDPQLSELKIFWHALQACLIALDCNCPRHTLLAFTMVGAVVNTREYAGLGEESARTLVLLVDEMHTFQQEHEHMSFTIDLITRSEVS